MSERVKCRSWSCIDRVACSHAKVHNYSEVCKQKEVNDCPPCKATREGKISIDKQEDVVEAVWDFIAENHEKEPTVFADKGGKRIPANLVAIDKLVEKAMGIFGYRVISIQ